jgi:hypothetical protein
MTTQIDTGTAVEGLLRDASRDRLVCLLRHWTCADEAMARFDRELATGWDPSAGTVSPSSIKMMSPGTISAAGMLRRSPLRMTAASAAGIARKAATAASARAC